MIDYLHKVVPIKLCRTQEASSDIVRDSPIQAAVGIQQRRRAGVSLVQPFCNTCTNPTQVVATGTISTMLKLMLIQ